jgi:phosphoribosylformylglycinamidine cyclo-ligase
LAQGPPKTASVTYADAGVNIDRANRTKQRIKYLAHQTFTKGVLSEIGGFGGLFSVPKTFLEPVLVSSVDGVGTKLKVAFEMKIHHTVGADLVNHCVNDIIVQGAMPLFFMDYLATGTLEPEVAEKIVEGIAEACKHNGCALIGGETAEHPGMLEEDEYDLAGTGVGVVEADAVLGSERVRAGDVVLAMESSGLHSNGYSLVRHALLRGARLRLDAEIDELDGVLGDVLLTPTRIYARDCLALIDEVDVHAFAHITGGGLAGNLSRVLPEGIGAVIHRGSWSLPPIFQLLQGRGKVDLDEMERTFNQGVGMVAVVPAEEADRACAMLTARHLPSWVAGEIVEDGKGEVRLTGSHPA